MIDRDLLIQCGWSNELIDAVIQVAEPMREAVSRAAPLKSSIEGMQSIACSAIFASSVVINTLSELTVAQSGNDDAHPKRAALK